MRFLFLMFIAIPIIEIAVLIQISQVIGALWTIILVILTAVIGISMLRVQGLATLTRAHWRMEEGRIPAQEMAEGVFIAVGGALLLTPGVITDAFGFMCLIPITRIWMLKAVQARLISVFTAHSSGTGGFQSHTHNQTQEQGVIIEGKVRRVDEDNKPDKDI